MQNQRNINVLNGREGQKSAHPSDTLHQWMSLTLSDIKLKLVKLTGHSFNQMRIIITGLKNKNGPRIRMMYKDYDCSQNIGKVPGTLEANDPFWLLPDNFIDFTLNL